MKIVSMRRLVYDNNLRPKWYLPVHRPYHIDGYYCYFFLIAPFALFCYIFIDVLHIIWSDLLNFRKMLKVWKGLDCNQNKKDDLK